MGSHKQIRLGLIMAAVAVSVCTVSVSLMSHVVSDFEEALEPANSILTAAELEQIIGIPIPIDLSVSNIQSIAYSFWQSQIIGIRFPITPEDLSIFLDELGVAQLQERLYPFHPNSQVLASVEWWTPDNAQEYAGLNFTRSQSFYDIMIDKTDPESLIVYLMIERS